MVMISPTLGLITSMPDDDSGSMLDNSVAVAPCFTPDVSGTYLVQLIVTDEHGLSGEPVTVTITATEGEEPALGDLNGDNVVDMAEARKLVLLCTCPRCVCP